MADEEPRQNVEQQETGQTGEGGIPHGAGGVSGTAHIETPVSASGEESKSSTGGIVDTVKSLLGFDTTTTTTTTTTSGSTAGGVKEGDTIIGSLTAATFGASGGIAAGQTADLVDRTKTTDASAAPASSLTAEDTTATTAATTSSSDSAPATDDSTTVTTADPSSSSSSAPDQTDDSADSKPTAVADNDGGDDSQVPAQKKSGGGGGGTNLENRDSIPTAGGEKLGEKHWGESKIVPDVPKTQSEEGVSSAAGQPTGEVADNTAKNTGSATGGPGADGHKQSLGDKIKDKIPFGKKD